VITCVYMDVNITYIHTDDYTCVYTYSATSNEPIAGHQPRRATLPPPRRDPCEMSFDTPSQIIVHFRCLKYSSISTQSLLKGSYVSPPFKAVSQFCTSVLFGQGPFAQEKWRFRGLFALLLTTFSIQLFLSWVPNTQLNHWTKRVVNTWIIT